MAHTCHFKSTCCAAYDLPLRGAVQPNCLQGTTGPASIRLHHIDLTLNVGRGVVYHQKKLAVHNTPLCRTELDNTSLRGEDTWLRPGPEDSKMTCISHVLWYCTILASVLIHVVSVYSAEISSHFSGAMQPFSLSHSRLTLEIGMLLMVTSYTFSNPVTTVDEDQTSGASVRHELRRARVQSQGSSGESVPVVNAVNRPQVGQRPNHLHNLQDAVYTTPQQTGLTPCQPRERVFSVKSHGCKAVVSISVCEGSCPTKVKLKRPHRGALPQLKPVPKSCQVKHGKPVFVSFNCTGKADMPGSRPLNLPRRLYFSATSCVCKKC